MIMQIPFGKTNRGFIRYGRATRHRDVRLCCIGGLSFYLNFRFFVTREFSNFTSEDWCNNRSWFDIKLLVDVHSKDNCSTLKKDSYSKKIRSILQELGLSYNKLVHLGRKLGAHMLDFLEELKEEKQLMGQWNPDVIDNHYSSKIPLRPIRKLAGYTTQQALYFCPRSVVEPDEMLLRLTPMGGWCIDALREMEEKARNAISGNYQTAVHVLKFFCYINKVFVQDSAAMLILHPDRMESSPIFKVIPVFRSSLFLKFLDKMKLALDSAQDPVDSRIDAVVPGLMKWHKNHQENFTKVLVELDSFKTQVNSKMDSISYDAKLDRLKQAHRISQTLERLSSSFTDSFESELREFEASATSKRSATSTSTTDETPAVQAGDGDTLEYHQQFKKRNVSGEKELLFAAEMSMVTKHATLKDLWDEWFGLDAYHDGFGGVIGRENRFGSEWRKKMVHSQHFSRTKRVISGIQSYAIQYGISDEAAIERLESTYEEFKCSLYNFFIFMQDNGHISKKARRGKSKSKSNESTNICS